MKIQSLFSSIMIVGILTGAALLISKATERPEQGVSEMNSGIILGKVQDFTMQNQLAKTVTSKDLEGHFWIANFIFTRCAGPCPLMSAQIKRLAEEFKFKKDIKFISFSVDPVYDTVEVLDNYSKKYEADPKQWYFLTGKKEDVFEVIIQHFKLGAGEVPEAEREAMDQMVWHSTKFALVDPNLMIRGYYDSESEDSLKKLKEDYLNLSKEMS